TMIEAIIANVDATDLAHLRHVAVGGGELSDDLRQRFLAKFGIEPLQGYGCAECAPIVALNVPDYGEGRELQPGTRRGTVGHPVPGVAVRIVDPDTGLPVASGVEGMLLVSGPNLMAGYVEGPELTRTVMNDGWYITGDRARLDADGFLTISHRSGASPAS
ncbi:MAG TPA: AMP-binding protein, partial [Candidatus Binataceae bacterium]|nr:AMP-binding protein [Candidatus Binataceae bacterium]